jgi:hypothetical protein
LLNGEILPHVTVAAVVGQPLRSSGAAKDNPPGRDLSRTTLDQRDSSFPAAPGLTVEHNVCY